MPTDNLTAFDRKTALCPAIIADIVWDNFDGDLSRVEGQRDWWADHCDSITRLIYKKNARFARKLRGNQSREYLAMFIHHWLTAFAQNPAKYRRMRGC